MFLPHSWDRPSRAAVGRGEGDEVPGQRDSGVWGLPRGTDCKL